MIRTYQGIQTNEISWNNAMRVMQQQQRQFYVQSRTLSFNRDSTTHLKPDDLVTSNRSQIL